MRSGANLVAVLAAAAVCSGCGSSTDRDAVSRGVREAIADLTHDRPAAFCRRLTPTAQRRALNFGTEYTGGGRHAPSERPRSCAEAIADQMYFARHDVAAGPTWLDKLRRSPDFEVKELKGDRAVVSVPVGGTTLYLRRTADGWRGERTDDFPFSGGTGE